MLKKIDDIYEFIANWILIITGVLVCVLIFSAAVMRYVAHKDFYGSEELILLAAFWLYFTGSALAAKHDTQIKAEMLGMFVKNPKVLGVFNIITHVINLIMSAMASVWAIQYVLWNVEMNTKSNVFRFPVVYAVLPVAISFVIWTIYCVRDMVNAVRNFGKPAAAEEGKEEK